MVAVAVAAMAARAAVVMTIVVAKAVPRAAPGAIPQALGEPFVKEQPAAREARRAHLRRGAARTGRSRQSTALVGASRHLANGALGRACAQLRAVVAERLDCLNTQILCEWLQGIPHGFRALQDSVQPAGKANRL